MNGSPGALAPSYGFAFCITSSFFRLMAANLPEFVVAEFVGSLWDTFDKLRAHGPEELHSLSPA